MPPLAPTDLTLTPKGSGFGAATLEWTHAGTTKYEVLYKRPYDSAYKTLHLANAAQFGSGPYAMEVPLTSSITYTVRAINAAGESSPKATDVVSTYDVAGTWLLPFEDGEINDDEWAWVGHQAVDLSSERNESLIAVPFRQAKVSVGTGIVHLYEGTVSGLLLTYHSMTPNEWLSRLETVMDRHKSYRWMWLAHPRWMFKVAITTGLEVSSHPSGYQVSFGVRELPHTYGA